jgi:RimJ/RimL family protein N-acetyltransferase
MIETPRLILRAPTHADRDAIAEVNCDPRVNTWLGANIDRAASDAGVDRVIAHIDRDGFGYWAAELKAEGLVVGLIGLSRVADVLPVAPGVEMGWRLAHRVWGRGLASEGAAAALAWGLANLPEPEILAFTASTNLASQTVMRKIGMTADPARDFDHPVLSPDHPLHRHVVFTARR